MSKSEVCRQSRPSVRIFSKKNIDTFSNYVSETDWSVVCCAEDVNIADNSFINIIQCAYELMKMLSL